MPPKYIPSHCEPTILIDAKLRHRQPLPNNYYYDYYYYKLPPCQLFNNVLTRDLEIVLRHLFRIPTTTREMQNTSHLYGFPPCSHMQWLTQPVWTSAQRVYLLYGSDDNKRSLRSRHPPPFIQFIKSTAIGTDGRILLHQARPVRLVPARSCYCSGGVYCLHRWVAHLSIYLATQSTIEDYMAIVLSFHVNILSYRFIFVVIRTQSPSPAIHSKTSWLTKGAGMSLIRYGRVDYIVIFPKGLTIKEVNTILYLPILTSTYLEILS